MLSHYFFFSSLILSVWSQVNVCPVWNEAQNTNTAGGTDVPLARTLDDCKAACLASTSACVNGFDWLPGGGTGTLCWISRTNVTSPSTGVSHYTCPSIKPTPAIQSSTTAKSGNAALPAGCSWTIAQNTNTPNGLQVSNANTVSDCQAACLASAEKCAYGFDWNPGNPEGLRCFISKVAIQNTGATSITHYGLQCESSTVPYVTTTQPSDSSCNWVVVNNSNSPGGSLQSSLRTFDQCRDSCYQFRNTTCKFGFDWNENVPEGSRCWFSASNATTTYNGVKHYNFQCTSRCIWNEVENSNSPGGVVQSSVTTLEQCKETCLSLKSTTCRHGIDWNANASSGTKCWFSTSNALTPYDGVYHYNHDCSGGLVTTGPGCSWDEMKNTNSPGGVPQSGLNTVEQCQASCIEKKDTTCMYGFDWDSSSPSNYRCWFSTSSATTSSNGVHHYYYKCSTVFSTTGPANVACNWVVKNNTNSPGGLLKGSTTSVGQCQDLCLQLKDTECKFGIDWDPQAGPGYRCWFSRSSSTTTANGVYHLNFECIDITSTTGETCSWNKVADTHTRGGIVQPSASTLELCKALCIGQKSTTCQYGFDFNSGAAPTQRCFFSTTNTTNAMTGLDHYTFSCIGSTPTACSWNKVADTHTRGGIVQSSASTLDQCKDLCIQQKSTTCQYGFDFNSGASGDKCFFATTSTTNALTGVDHYTYSCTTDVTATGATVTSGGCGWVTLSDTNSPQGVVQGLVTSEEQCRSTCLAQKDTNCKFGFDWNPKSSQGTQCWFSTSNATTSYPGVNHYNYVCSSATVPTPTIPACTWTRVNNTNSPGGQPQASLMTEETCRNGCLQRKETDCKFGIDFNPKAAETLRCWFSVSTARTTFEGVFHDTYVC